MIKVKITIIILTCFVSTNGFTQPCGTLGQTPGSAFPLCGNQIFRKASVPICDNGVIPTPCPRITLTDKNPYWYKFTCFSGGTLGFLITPNNLFDDYDWQLFDVTNHNPNDVYTDPSLFVACNWSGERGITGASDSGTTLDLCANVGVPIFSSMPTLRFDHDYLLEITHFTNSQSGYSLEFTGGTAIITDAKIPNFLSARASCDGSKIYIKFNKKIQCSSLSSDGSDFDLTPAIVPIIGATGIGCNSGFDMDSAVITLGGSLPPGNYAIQVKTGTDGNNILDICSVYIASGQSIPLTVVPIAETPIGSIGKVGCGPDSLVLFFKDPIRCSSIAANGSDFTVTGPAAVNIISASGICNSDGLTNSIKLKLGAPIQQAGTFTIQLKTGADGNTIINECGKETTPGSSFLFTTKDAVSAAFKSNIHYGCVSDTIFYTHDGNNGVNSWQWNFDNTINSSIKDPIIIYAAFGQKQTTLIVSNGTCSDTASNSVFLEEPITALFESPSFICPGDPASFTDKSTGSLNNSWLWDFGNGNTSTLQNPPKQLYPLTSAVHDVLVHLIVTNSVGCIDTATNTVKVAGNCYIGIPKAFTPNGDGLNDYLYPTNAYKAKDLLFAVYNRLGQKIFETHDWSTKWDGTFKGTPQEAGTYVWLLTYTDADTGEKIQRKGTTVLIR